MITAVVVQQRPVAQVAAEYGVHRSWIYKLLARYRQEGPEAFMARSRRPQRSPRRMPDDLVARILTLRDQLVSAGHDAGPETIRWHLHRSGQVTSRATIARVLSAHGRVQPQPKKKPRSAWNRFEAEQPNQTWQSDITHYRLTSHTDTEIITWLDDHSRYVTHLSAHPVVTAQTVLASFRAATTTHGPPAATLTDNGMVYTVRHASAPRRGGRTALENELATLGIHQKNSRPNHPTTCGKVERFQQTLKNWLRAQPNQPVTISDLQALLDTFADYYNHHRPHRALHGKTPHAAYQARPKATPHGEPPAPTHSRVRTDKVNNGKVTLRHGGTLYQIGIGRAHNTRAVLLLINGPAITIIDKHTGELIRQLTLDPTRRYQPQQPKQGEP